MLEAKFKHHTFKFKIPGGTSRGVLTEKKAYFIKVWDQDNPDQFGLGECSYIPGLSIDNLDEIESCLEKIVINVNAPYEELLGMADEFPCVRFGLEMAFSSLKNGNAFKLNHNPFFNKSLPLKTNGLIWMGNKKFMQEQIKTKLELGFSCLKMKVGAIDFETELEILAEIRKEFDEHDLTLRVDANGAFSPSDALNKLERLSELALHSIEQPIMAGQWSEMAKLCEKTPIPIALDEELIGVKVSEIPQLLDLIMPQYIILKPSLIGGIEVSKEWIQHAGQRSIPWWITSALESNLGLNAIAQFVSNYYNPLPQGLGTGQLYTENIPSPLNLQGEYLSYDSEGSWDTSIIEF